MHNFLRDQQQQALDDGKHVATGKRVCKVCGDGLLHKQRLAIPDEHKLTGWGYCPEHQQQIDDGFVFLLEADNAIPKGDNPVLQADTARRTGRYIAMRRALFNDLFDAPHDGYSSFIDVEGFEMIIALHEGRLVLDVEASA